MTWTETHRYYEALRTALAEVERTGTMPWRGEFAEVFGDSAGLLLALRRHWDLMVRAQVEQPDDLRTLARRHRGLLAVLRRHEVAEPSRPALVQGVVA